MEFQYFIFPHLQSDSVREKDRAIPSHVDTKIQLKWTFAIPFLT